MKGTVAIIVGILSGCAFVIAWLVDPGAKVTLVTTLMCGIASIMIQLTGRDLVGRAQNFIDRGADETVLDGGELFAHGRRMKDRIEKLLLTALSGGILAAFFATVRVLDDRPIWGAAAFSFSTAAVVISLLLFSANRALGTLIDFERVRRARDAAAKRAAGSGQPMDESDYTNHPNLNGYGTGKSDTAHPA